MLPGPALALVAFAIPFAEPFVLFRQGFAGATRASESEMQRRASGWLVRELAEEVPPTSDKALARLALGTAALLRSGFQELTETRVLQFRLQACQRADGSFGFGSDRRATTRWALGALPSPPVPSEDVSRARTFLGIDAASATLPPAPEGRTDATASALEFLRNPQAARAPGSPRDSAGKEQELAFVAGAELDLQKAQAFVRARPRELGTGLVAALELPALDAGWHERHLAVRILAYQRTPRLVSAGGAEVWWPDEFRAALHSSWNEPRGAWARAPGGEPSVLETACALLALDAAAPWLALDRAALERVEATTPREVASLGHDCEDCHRQLEPGLAAQFDQSTHATAGLGCVDCHGENHSRIFREEGRVSPAICGECHVREAAEFARSRHARAEETLLASSLFEHTPRELQSVCLACHAIGARHADGSRGSCNQCHASHLFRAEFARRPEACVACHTGDDYPEERAYELSKHGVLYALSGNPEVAPTCVTCHQPDGTHDAGFGITLGANASGSIRARSSEGTERGRAEMVGVCSHCHSSRFARESLAQADRIREEGERMLGQALDLLGQLAQEGLIPVDADRSLEGASLDPSLRALPILERFHRVWRFEYAASWKGAYHASPSVTNSASPGGLRESLESLRAEAARLREAKLREEGVR